MICLRPSTRNLDRRLPRTRHTTHYNLPGEWLEDLKELSVNLLKPLLSISINEEPWSTFQTGNITAHIRQWLCPEKVLVLDDIIIDSDVQKEIFGLLSLKEIGDSIIANLEEPQETASGLKRIIEESQNKLQDQVIEKHWEELGNILAKVPGLKGLPGFMEKEKEHKYEKLLDCIRKAIIYKKLMEATEEGDNKSLVCPDGFLDDIKQKTGVDIDEEIQGRIFNLLTTEEIVYYLKFFGFDKQKEQGIKEFISTNNKCKRCLCGEVIDKHWNELGKILAKVPGWEGLPGFMEAEKNRSYSNLLECIRKANETTTGN